MFIIFLQLALLLVYCNKVDGELANDDTLASTLARLAQQSVAVNKLKDMLDADDSTPGATEAKVIVMEALIKKNGGDFLLALLTTDEIQDILIQTVGVSDMNPTEDVVGLQLGEHCNSSTTTCSVINSECQNNICTCKENYKQSGKKCANKLFGAVNSILKSESQHIKELKQNLAVLQSSLASLNKSMDQDVDILKSTIETLNNTNIELSDELTQLRDETNLHNETLHKINRTFAEANGTLISQEKVIKNLEHRLKNLTSAANETSDDVTLLTTALKHLKGNNTDLKNENDQVKTNMSALTAELDKISKSRAMLREKCMEAGFTKLGSQCYYISKGEDQGTRKEAMSKCNLLSATLLNMDSSAENQRIKAHLKKINPGSYVYYWTNLHRHAGTWRWNDGEDGGEGEETQFTDWNSSSNSQGPDGKYECMFLYSGDSYKWWAHSCSVDNFNYICKV